MSDNKIIPFKPRPRLPSEQELEAFQRATRNWHPQLREFMLPDHMKQSSKRSDD